MNAQGRNANHAYERACALISQAFALPETAREAFLAEHYSQDDALRRELSWMIEALHGPEQDVMGRSTVAGPLDPATQLHVHASRDYRLLQCLGQGGMGQVYLAERHSGDVSDRVALKLLNPLVLGDDRAMARFGAERQILSHLEHPNIARMLDAGVLSDGQPFLAMEYVDGEVIDRYCQTHDLSMSARLQLFIRLCSAVQYAHQQLVIHRDIKPGNVLVTAAGEPKLLDFGIARLLDQSQQLTDTAAGARVMTLAYASPEQIVGAPLSVATDVYSLGVLLYELVAGRTPWSADTLTQLLVDRTSREPEPPSSWHHQAGSRGTWRRWIGGEGRTQLSADLDAIVLKAIRKEPEARYLSVAEFSNDVERLLEHRPIKARQGHALYRFRKFATRHRYALTWIIVLAGVLGATAIEREHQLRMTEQARSNEAQISELMVTALGSIDPDNSAKHTPGTEKVLSMLTERILQMPWLDALREVKLLATVGTLQFKWGRHDDSRQIFEKAWDIAQGNPQAVDAQIRINIADGLGAANVRDAAAAERWYRRSVELARTELGADSMATAKAELAFANYLLGKSTDHEQDIRDYSRHALDTLSRIPESGERPALFARFHAARNLWNLDGDAASFIAVIDEILTGMKAKDVPASRMVDILSSRANALAAERRYESALAQAMDIASQADSELGSDHPTTYAIHSQLTYFAILAGAWELVGREARHLLVQINTNGSLDNAQKIWGAYYIVRGLAPLNGYRRELATATSLAAAIDNGDADGLTPAEHALVTYCEALHAFTTNATELAEKKIAMAQKSATTFARRRDLDEIKADILLLGARIALARRDRDAAIDRAREAKTLRPEVSPYADVIMADARWNTAPAKDALAMFEQGIGDAVSEPSERCAESQWIASRLPIAAGQGLSAQAKTALRRCADETALKRL